MSSKHASKRAQQRGIPPLIPRWLEEYGEEAHDRRGSIVLYFSKRARRRLERDVGRQVTAKLDEWLDAYLVISTDGTRITTGHRYRRIPR